MLGLAHGFASRLAAVAVALALAGLPQLIEPPEHAASHRCQCPVREGKHECDCPLCHAEAARLGKSAADDPNLPACHRALAARSRAEADRSAKRRSAAGPCLTSTCGNSDERLRSPSAADGFTIPPPWQLLVRIISVDVPVASDLVLSALGEPETPPPRAA
jgi:hypothetical protein